MTTKQSGSHMPKRFAYPLILISAFIILTVVSFVFFKSFDHIRRGGGFRKHDAPRPLINIDKIQGWMTFGYINRSFGLPDDYLKTELNIANATYPNITLAKVALGQGGDLKDFIMRVKKSIQQYMPKAPQP